ncbi:MAG: 3'-5' exonuclease [Spirochaetaceae bacterium]|nr:3'-5' exonuclease [Spirochaetaceae bacterium]
MEYSYINSDLQIEELLSKWRKTDIVQVAMDFECESNLHCYGEHLCLIQVFDGYNYYLIDPLPQAGTVSNAGLKALLESKDIQKLWFDCSSDGSLVWKKHGIKIAALYDLFLEAKILGIQENLSAMVQRFVTNTMESDNITPEEVIKAKNSKKKFQQANWMLRPISAGQLEYALSDVAHLFPLRLALDNLAKEKNKLKAVQESMKHLPHLKTKQPAGYTKLPGYKHMNHRQKIYAKHFFHAWDSVAQEFNWPPYKVLNKHTVARLAQKVPINEVAFKAEAQIPNKAVEAKLLPLLLEAKGKAEKEIASENSKP